MKKRNLLERLLGSSPKTTIAGFVKGVVSFLITYIAANGFDPKNPLFWLGIAYGILEIIKGRIQKDSNGITAEQSQELHAEVKTLVDPTSTPPAKPFNIN